jgi:tRNA(fMet)-specific endonuclease VapC
MPWLLDTNHWIKLLKGRCAPLEERLRDVPPAEVWLCSVVKEELLHGALGYERPEQRLAVLEELCAKHPSMPFDDLAAGAAARIRRDLEVRGCIIGPHDLQIAAVAQSCGWVLATNNTAEFSRVSGSLAGSPVSDVLVRIIDGAAHFRTEDRRLDESQRISERLFPSYFLKMKYTAPHMQRAAHR